MVLTPPMVFSQTDGNVSVLPDHTCTRGPSGACMRDFLLNYVTITRNRLFYGIASLRGLVNITIYMVNRDYRHYMLQNIVHKP